MLSRFAKFLEYKVLVVNTLWIHTRYKSYQFFGNSIRYPRLLNDKYDANFSYLKVRGIDFSRIGDHVIDCGLVKV